VIKSEAKKANAANGPRRRNAAPTRKQLVITQIVTPVRLVTIKLPALHDTQTNTGTASSREKAVVKSDNNWYLLATSYAFLLYC